jgi:hypothetical protein
MSDLTARMNAVTARQDETNAKLDAILAALGTPPPTQTVTLADVVNALDISNARLLTISNAIVTSNQTLTAILLRLETISTNITSVLGNTQAIATDADISAARLTDIETLIDQFTTSWFSGAGGLQYLENIYFGQVDLRNAIYATFCPCENSAPALPPPLNVNPLQSSQQIEHCRRVQWMIDEFFDDWMRKIADAINLVGITGVGLSLAALTATGIGAVPLALIAGGGAAVSAAWRLGINGVYEQAGSAERAVLRQALYNAPTASAAAQAWNTAIDGMGDVPEAYRTVWKTLIWASWFNDLYDQAGKNSTTVPGAWETDGYDGTLCISSTLTCYSNSSVSVGGSPNLEYRPVWSSGVTMRQWFDNAGNFTYIGPSVAGWTVINDRNVGIKLYVWSDPNTLIVNTTVPAFGTAVIPSSIGRGYIDLTAGGAANQVKLCQP